MNEKLKEYNNYVCLVDIIVRRLTVNIRNKTSQSTQKEQKAIQSHFP